jgi:peptidoglycan hydrolase-like protein with peptidoglycan-binding domain
VTISPPLRPPVRRELRRKRSHRGRWIALAAFALAVVAVAAGVWLMSGATLAGDPVALGRVDLQPLAGSLIRVRARTEDGRALPLEVSHGRITPRVKIAPGATITLSVTIRRPGWSSWALGDERHETLTVEAPAAHVASRWVTVPRGGRAEVRFDADVDRVSIAGARVSGDTMTLPTHAAAGAVAVAAAARPWEKLGAPERVTWFPKASHPVVLTTPKPNGHTDPLQPIRLTFSQPVSRVLGDRQPTIAPSVPGRWTTPDDHTLLFKPSGNGAPFNSALDVRFPTALAVMNPARSAARTSTKLHLAVSEASFLRLQQLLAMEGYLPVVWTPTEPVPKPTMRSELAAAVDPPAGHFTWRYPNTPHELQSLWRTGEPNQVTRGAVMMFQDEHDLTVDAIAGPKVWHAVMADAVAGKRRDGGYSYVYVHRTVPQRLTLWHNGETVLTSPGNTGVPAAPTDLGTWPVFEHIPVGTMSGTNPDGSHYNDPGIRWISYFHGGEALHAFPRASFGTPQSLGCVELPMESAARVWPYTPIGTLVTIED